MATTFRSSPTRTAARTVGILAAIAAIFALVIAGITFMGLAIAFPIALPVAEQFNVPVKPSDIEIARQFAGFWWAFAVASAASFIAAVVVAVKVIERASPVPNDF